MTSEDVFPGRVAFEVDPNEPALPNGQSLAYVERAYASLIKSLPSKETRSSFASQLRHWTVRAVARAYLVERRLIARI